MPTPIEQLLSRTVYDTDGVTTIWDFSFADGYLDPSHVKAYTTDAIGLREDIVVTPVMLIGEFQLQVTPALVDDLVLTIYRDTPKDAPLVDFTDESGFSEIALDTNARQAVMVAAEAIDTISTSDIQGAVEAAETAAAAAAQAAIDAGAAATAAATASAAVILAEAAASSAAASAATINPDNLATAAQGALADSALQPGEAATPAQGAKSDSALQPADAASFATAAQGGKADTALQPAAVGVSIPSRIETTLKVAVMPSAGSYTVGDVVLEYSSTASLSGWKRLTTGSGHVLNTDWSYFSGMTSGTPVATTSGASIDFTGIPSWVKRVTLLLNGVSSNGASGWRVQLGTGGSPTTSGYAGASGRVYSGGPSATAAASGFDFNIDSGLFIFSGALTFTHLGANIWIASGTIGSAANVVMAITLGGKIPLAGVLGNLRFSTINGTDTFDAGSINILLE